jgi:GNAT superfamily N-acetyltransferase
METALCIRSLAPAEARGLAAGLGEVLADCVAGGAGVNFMAGLTAAEAAAWWDEELACDDGRAVFVAEDALGPCGVVQLVPARQQNQPHRADISKMLVHRRARRRGLGEALLRAAEAEALAAGRWLLTLDTVKDSDAERMYRRLGWTCFGVVPDYALLPDGRPWPASFFYKALAR